MWSVIKFYKLLIGKDMKKLDLMAVSVRSTTTMAKLNKGVNSVNNLVHI